MNDSLSAKIDSEKSILGVMICFHKTMDFFIENIRAKDFIDKRHKIIFKAIQYLFFQGVSIDLISLAGVLKATGKLKECGGSLYIAELYEEFNNTEYSGH